MCVGMYVYVYIYVYMCLQFFGKKYKNFGIAKNIQKIQRQ
jgi:hypothetical protein